MAALNGKQFKYRSTRADGTVYAGVITFDSAVYNTWITQCWVYAQVKALMDDTEVIGMTCSHGGYNYDAKPFKNVYATEAGLRQKVLYDTKPLMNGCVHVSRPPYYWILKVAMIAVPLAAVLIIIQWIF